jgi:hypothetical protein
MTPKDLAYLHHMLDAIIHIENFSKGIASASDLKDHPLERAGIERMLTILGEPRTYPRNCERNSLLYPGRRLRECVIRSCTTTSELITKQCLKRSGLIFRFSNRESVLFLRVRKL